MSHKSGIELPHKEGEVKTRRLFALFPQKVMGRWIWMKHYYLHFKYSVRDRVICLLDGSVLYIKNLGGWDEIPERKTK